MTMQMRDEINLSYLGLVDRDIAVLRSMVGLIPEESLRIKLLSPVEIDLCDVILVNADSRLALSWWRACKSRDPLVVPLMLSRRDLPTGRIATICRPLKIEKLTAAIQLISKMQLSGAEDHVSIDDKMRVLVVDDSYSVRQYMGHTLQRLLPEALDVSFAENGVEAMNLIWNQPFDVVFLDVVMPGMDGYKVCKAIKSEQFAAVIMLTSRKSPFDKVRGTMSGCDAFLTKPPDPQGLKALLEEFMHKKHADCSGRFVQAAGSSRAVGFYPVTTDG